MPSDDEQHRGGQGHPSSPVAGSATAPSLCPHAAASPTGQAGGDALPWVFPAALLKPSRSCPQARGCLYGTAPSKPHSRGVWGSLPSWHTPQLPFGGLLRCHGCSLCYTESLPTWLLIRIRADVNTGVIFSGMISDCLPLPCYHGD